MRNNISKISIILPTYNAEKFLERAVNSILSQTFSNWELIIVDDCSSDGTKDLILKLANKNEKIKYIFLEENSGSPASPHNVGFNYSTGDYIAYIDQDDEWLPHKLEKQLNLFLNSKKQPLGLVSCYFNVIDLQYNKKILQKVEIPSSLEDIIYYPSRYFPGNSGILLSRSVILKVGERDKNVGCFEDIDFAMRVGINGFLFDCVQDPLFNYYIHKDNFSSEGFQFLDINKSKKMSVWIENFTLKHYDILNKKKRILSFYLRGVHIYYYFSGDKNKSFKYLIKAIKTDPYNLKNYMHLFLMKIPPLYKLIFITKRLFLRIKKRVEYLNL